MTGLGNSQFRERTIVRNSEPEPLDDRAEVTAPREWVVLAGLGLALAALVAWGVFGSVERTLRADGVLVLSGERRTVRSGAAGAVTEIEAPAGRRVAPGQVIVRVALAQRAAAPAEATIVSPGNGVVAALLVMPGQTIPAGAPVADVVYGAARRMDAVAFVPPRAAWRLAAGMSARVAVESPEGGRVLPARLAAIAPRAASPPGWLTRMLPHAGLPARGHLLRIAFANPPGPGLPDDALRRLDDGTPCRIEVVVERTSPFSLLIRG